jgi:hypothetical protein
MGQARAFFLARRSSGRIEAECLTRLPRSVQSRRKDGLSAYPKACLSAQDVVTYRDCSASLRRVCDRLPL